MTRMIHHEVELALEPALSEPKVGPTEFAAEVERLKAEGKLPSLETLLAAIAETRAKYREKILAARKTRRVK